jgi:hypothetical protein
MKKTKANPRQSKKGDKKLVINKTKDVPDIRDLLLNGPKFDLIIPERTRWKRRPPVIFD